MRHIVPLASFVPRPQRNFTQLKSCPPIPASSNLTPWTNLRIGGVNLAAWARDKGFNPQLVYLVARGERKCLRGQSHAIAKELGMK